METCLESPFEKGNLDTENSSASAGALFSADLRGFSHFVDSFSGKEENLVFLSSKYSTNKLTSKPL